jgi:shikimate kinase
VNLVLIGYRGTGKSAVALKLSELLGFRVISLDQEIIKAEGHSIPEIVAAKGWTYFRDVEESVCRQFGSQDGQILDAGGGVVEREANFLSLRQNGRVVWLRATPSTIVRRIGGDTQRPSLTGTKSFTEEVEEVLSKRSPLYERMAHHGVDTDGRAILDIASTVARLFQVTP